MLLWTFPLIMLAAIVIGWGAEVTAVHLSAGIALAVLAWLQTSPEFAVEASIAWNRDAHLALANLTGSLRLLMGLGWPMVFFIHWFCEMRRRKRVRDVVLPEAFSVEAAGLAIPVIYFLWIHIKGTWSAIDGVILCSFYAVYFWMLNLERKAGLSSQIGEVEDAPEPWVVEKVLALPKRWQYAATLAMFAFGGGVLYFTVHPFVESLKSAAFAIGVSEFVFIQWVAPIASEFPEKVTAFNWARSAKKVPMAVVNMLSSVTSQWTLLAGLVPIIFSLSAGHLYTIELSPFQKTELLLTIFQSAVAVILLADLKIKDYEAVGLFVLWLCQFVMPKSREPLVWVYGFWFAFEAFMLVRARGQFHAWYALRKIFAAAGNASRRETK
jgi:cation:H+ antiporter